MARPLKWPDSKAKEVEKRINAFFTQRDADDKPYTINGLTLALDLGSKSSLYEMRDNRAHQPIVSGLIKRALLTIEDMHECKLGSGKPVGSIFALKNSSDAGGWKDKAEVDHKVSGSLTVCTGVPDAE